MAANIRSPVAVVGLATLMPGSSGIDAFWLDVQEGVDRIREVPPTHWLPEDLYDPDPTAPDKTYCRRGGFLDPQHFDAMRFGLPPSVVPATDTTQLLGLVVAQEILDTLERDAPVPVDRERTSVVIGVTAGQELLTEMGARMGRPQWVAGLRQAGLPEDKVQEACDRIAALFPAWQEGSFPGMLPNVTAGRIANRLDLHGTNCTVDAACASSLAALSMGLNELYLGDADLVLAGGADTLNDPTSFLCFSKTPALSRSQDCRPFSDAGDGTMLGEGVGLLALKRLEDAERDGNRIHAVIRGLGSSSDGRHKSIYAPRAAGQRLALHRAYEHAGYDPATVELIEGHGTGTRAGDATEIEGLRTALADVGERCALGSVKSQIGHTKGAAGVASLAKVVQALSHRVLPPTVKVERPHPALLEGETRFYVNTRARPWVRGADHPRRAGVSSFGFGGTNFHVTVEEYTGPHRAPRTRNTHGELVVLAASSAEELLARIDALDASAPGALRWLSWSSPRDVDPALPARLAVLAGDEAELTARLAAARKRIAADPATELHAPGLHYALGAEAGGVALLFPGQGSQRVDMGADAAMTWDAALSVWDDLAELELEPGAPLHAVVFPEPAFDDAAREAREARLVRTEWAQPGLVATSAALLALLHRAGVTPAAVAGHSLGEITALYASGVLDLRTAVRIARRRGELMAEAAARPGAMTAAAASAAALDPVPEGVVVANENGPHQTVLSGPIQAIAAAEEALAERGVRCKRLRVSTAFHSPVVADAAAALRVALDDFEMAAPRIPVLDHGSASPYPHDPAAIRDRLAAQVAGPVRFSAQIEALWTAGIHTFVEVGPGNVLTRLVGEILADRPHTAIETDRRGARGDLVLLEALGRLLVAGVPVNLAALWEGHATPRDPATAPRPKVALEITGATYDKPYPPPGGAAALPPPNPTPPRAEPSRAPVAPAPSSVAPSSDVPADDPVTRAHLMWLDAMARSFDALAHAREEMARVHEIYLLGEAAPAQSQTPEAAERAEPAYRAVPQPMAPPPTPAQPIAPPPTPTEPMAPPPTPARMAPPPAAPAPEGTDATPAVGLVALLLDVVADKTGYPADMLDLDMALEGDLGIDSIKRVEILSALRERAPHLPDVDAARLADLQTLAQIADFLGQTGTEPAPTPTSEVVPAAAPAPAIDRFEVRWVPQNSVGSCPVSLMELGPLYVTADAGGVAEALVALLRDRGATAEVVRQVPADARAVILLDGLDGDGSPEDAERLALRALGVARGLAPRLGAEPGLLVTVQDTGGDLGFSGSERGAVGLLAGLAKTARAEWPEATVRALDVEQGNRPAVVVAEAILEEILVGGDDVEVGLRADGTRGAPDCVPVSAPSEGELPLDRGDLVVVSGGGRGVTAACAIALAEATGARFLLLGRTPLEGEPPAAREAATERELKRALLELDPEQPLAAIGTRTRRILAAREVRRTLAAIEAAGGEARYASVDVTDPEAVATVVATAREAWGPVRGVVHGAGVLADRVLADKTDEELLRVYRTKVGGLHALLDATVDDPLRALVLFSSIAARAGNAGQADYAMANTVLDKLAASEARRRGPACTVRSVQWGPWDGGMVDASLARVFAERGVPLIPLAEGTRRLVDELRAGPGGPIEVVIGADPRTFGTPWLATRQLRIAIAVDAVSHPYLVDHAIRGRVVLPLAVVLDWFARASGALRPDLQLAAIRDLRVLAGVKLDGYGTGADHLEIHAEQVENGDGSTVALELLGAGGTAHYRATARLETVRPAPEQNTEPQIAPWVWDESAYGRVLFHGPAFQAIRTVDALDAHGGIGDVASARALGWPANGWAVDPALVDGGLQVACLWFAERQGGLGLPMGVERCVTYGPVAPEHGGHCVLQGAFRDGSCGTVDLRISDPEGHPLLDLFGVDFVLAPGGTSGG